jgi:hypothetical protein
MKAMRHVDTNGEGFVYFVTEETPGGLGYLKIGRSKTPENRIADMQVGNSRQLTLVGCLEGGAELERSFHQLFGQLRHRGEWFLYTESLKALVECLDFWKPIEVEELVEVDESSKAEEPPLALPVGALKETTLIEVNGETRTLGEAVLIAAMQNRPSWK